MQQEGHVKKQRLTRSTDLLTAACKECLPLGVKAKKPHGLRATLPRLLGANCTNSESQGIATRRRIRHECPEAAVAAEAAERGASPQASNTWIEILSPTTLSSPGTIARSFGVDEVCLRGAGGGVVWCVFSRFCLSAI